MNKLKLMNYRSSTSRSKTYFDYAESQYNDEYLSEHLALRGETMLNKLYLSPQPRYSEDIDLVQINAEPIKETIERIRSVLLILQL